MKFKGLLIISILLLILSIGIVSASDNLTDDNLSQDTSQDTLEVTPVNGSSFSDVQKAVDSSKKNDIIEIEGYFSGSRNAINVNKDLIIQSSSKGATLDAKKMSSVFNIKANVTLKNLVIKNSGDSAIVVTDCGYCKVCIINCTFLHNGGTDCYSGGAISCNMGELSIINSTFNANKAGSACAVWYYAYYNQKSEIVNCTFINHPANVIDTGGYLEVTNSTFENNGDSSSLGGVIYSLGELYVRNSRFINNNAMYGGAIYSCWNNMTVENCIFDKNTAGSDGGTIYSTSVLYSDDVIFANIRISNSNITNSKASGKGGAICTYFSNLYLTNTSIASLGAGEDIFMDIGDFKNITASYNKIKRIITHTASLSASKLTTTYDSRSGLKVSMIDKDYKCALEERKVHVKVFSGKKSKEYVLTIYDDDDYVAAWLSIDKDFSLGKHKVEITSLSKYYDAKKITTYITINKAKTIVKAPKVTAKYKKSKTFQLTVKNKASGYKVTNIKVKIKVYTGKKSKTYTVKTNKKGVASINTKKLKKGTHKVKITSGNKNYIISKTSKIIIK